MTPNIQDIRRQNLDLLIEEANGVLRLAQRAGCAHSQISQIKCRLTYLAADGTRKVRQMGGLFARKLERAMGKPDGWMDIPHVPASAETDDLGTGRVPLSSEARRIGEQLDRITDPEQRRHAVARCMFTVYNPPVLEFDLGPDMSAYRPSVDALRIAMQLDRISDPVHRRYALATCNFAAFSASPESAPQPQESQLAPAQADQVAGRLGPFPSRGTPADLPTQAALQHRTT